MTRPSGRRSSSRRTSARRTRVARLPSSSARRAGVSFVGSRSAGRRNVLTTLRTSAASVLTTDSRVVVEKLADTMIVCAAAVTPTMTRKMPYTRTNNTGLRTRAGLPNKLETPPRSSLAGCCATSGTPTAGSHRTEVLRGPVAPSFRRFGSSVGARRRSGVAGPGAARRTHRTPAPRRCRSPGNPAL